MNKNILSEDLKLAVLDFQNDTKKTVAEQILTNAAKFIEFLPSSIATPEIAIEEDGDIAFDWMTEKDKILSISIGLSSRIPYALINGKNKFHGVFNSNELPEEILAYFKSIDEQDEA